MILDIFVILKLRGLIMTKGINVIITLKYVYCFQKADVAQRP